MTCNNAWSGANPDFVNLGGTSAAAPTSAGAWCWTDLRSNDDPIIHKAVLINTADTWTDNGTSTTADDGSVTGSQWNKVYGWGYPDLWEAWFNAPIRS